MQGKSFAIAENMLNGQCAAQYRSAAVQLRDIIIYICIHVYDYG